MRFAIFLLALILIVSVVIAEDVPYAMVKLQLTFPDEGRQVRDYVNALDNLSSKCGISQTTIIPNGAKADWVVYTPLTQTTTDDTTTTTTISIDDFKRECNNAFEDNKKDLTAGRSKFKISSITEVMLDSTCSSTCGASPCPKCPIGTPCDPLIESGDNGICGSPGRCMTMDGGEKEGQTLCVASASIYSLIGASLTTCIAAMLMFVYMM